MYRGKRNSRTNSQAAMDRPGPNRVEYADTTLLKSDFYADPEFAAFCAKFKGEIEKMSARDAMYLAWQAGTHRGASSPYC